MLLPYLQRQLICSLFYKPGMETIHLRNKSRSLQPKPTGKHTALVNYGGGDEHFSLENQSVTNIQVKSLN